MSTTEVNIGGVETFSVVDYPGKIAAVFFLQGCPWRCPFCYNALLQEINKKNDAAWVDFIDFLKKRKGMLNAVVFSGGEPLVQDKLQDAILDVKSLGGFDVGLHTGGYRPEMLKRILPNLSWVGFDIKAPFEVDKYKKAVGRDVDYLPKVLDSFEALLSSGIDFECRTTCDPRILDISDIYTIAETLKAKGVKKFFLQKYRPIEGDNTPESECLKFFNDKKLEDFLRSSLIEFEFRK